MFGENASLEVDEARSFDNNNNNNDMEDFMMLMSVTLIASGDYNSVSIAVDTRCYKISNMLTQTNCVKMW